MSLKPPKPSKQSRNKRKEELRKQLAQQSRSALNPALLAKSAKSLLG